MWVCMLVVVMGSAAAGREALTARVSSNAALAPSDVVIRALIEPDARNRSVSFVIDSAGFYSSSAAELEGDRAPRAKEVRFRMVPAGSYTVRVTLFGTDGKRGEFVRDLKLW
jgi:hypothetical protein